jgi:type I restriction enzyme M protein
VRVRVIEIAPPRDYAPGVAAAEVRALIVPHGKLLDFIDGTLRDDTPEEYVRQEIEKSLVREYKYDRTEMKIEFSVKMGVARKRCDIAIFPEGAPQNQENVWAICECKAASIPPDHRTEGVEQLKTYMAACANAEYGMWTNGQERFCYRKLPTRVGWDFADIADIPVKGRPPEEAERPSRMSLKAAESDALLFTFRRCHNYIAGNQGLQKQQAFWELLKLIFCKIEDERSDDEPQFYATTQEWQALNGQMKVRARLSALFQQVRETYPSIFDPNEDIRLEPRVLAYIVNQLEHYSLLESEIDVKGKAYEEIVGSNLRGDRGEFFTPRNVCRMAVEMLDPGPRDFVLDPACGTGGFLIVAMNHVRQKIRASEQRKWKGDDPTGHQVEELLRKEREYLNKRIVGIDINPDLVKAAKMNMVMNNDGSGGLYRGNSLERPATWSDELRKRDLMDSVDVLFTNPPFGTKIRVAELSILEQYDLAYAWDYDEETDTWAMRDPPTLTKAQPPEILFVERCVRLLKRGTGRLAIVLPDAILGAPGLGHVREWILQQTRVLASIDMHPDTFQPGNSTQTSLLVLERKSFAQIELEKAAGHKNDYNVFLALANHIGHDKRGNRTYRRDAEGNEVLEPRKERRRDLYGDLPVFHEFETVERVPDDTTLLIAERFRQWLRDHL